MIRALVVGELRADPQQRTGKNGKPFALARLSVPMGDQGRQGGAAAGDPFDDDVDWMGA